MNSTDEKLGYLIAKVEEQGKDLKTVTERFDALEREVREKFKTVETTFRVLKFLGYAVAAVLTFKFGDLPALWKNFFG